jgi:hypothetical protein
VTCTFAAAGLKRLLSGRPLLFATGSPDVGTSYVSDNLPSAANVGIARLMVEDTRPT